MKMCTSKVVALLLAVCMIIGIAPMNLLAVTYAEAEDDYYKVITKDDYELAPGIIESEIVLNNAEGTHRQVAHVVEVDLNNEYTKVIPSYKGMIPEGGSYGVQIMSEQAAWAESNGYGNVVAAMNLSLSWYDSAYYAQNPHLVGEPLGYMVLDGEIYMNSQGQTAGAQTCVVINFDEKDGVVRPADMPKVEIRSTSSAITGWEEQVIPANFGFLVKDGVNQYSLDNNPNNGASRSFVGVKADGTFVMVMNDGRQAPYSTGFTNYEMAEFMISLGCVAAVNGDGGGSSAFLSQRPGEELKLHCSPSDGAERPTTHGVLIITTAPSDGTFVRAQVTAPNDYYTPGSSIQFTAVGADLAGSAADIPADAVWQLSDPSMGTIENGLFVSNGKVGTVSAQLVYNGEVVGEDMVHVVVPESLAFVQSNITAPYSKSVTLDVVGKYGYNEVVLKSDDITYTLSNDAMGTLDGSVFTATSDTDVTDGVVTATLTHDRNVCVSANITFGLASKIVYDFESGTDSIENIYLSYKTPYIPDDYNFNDTLNVVSAADGGKVKNGQYALKVNCDGDSITCMNWCQTRINGWGIDLTDAISLSFWMYIPEGSHGYEWDFGNAIPVNLGHEFMYGTGWQYFTVNVADIGTNVTSLDQIRLYHSDTSCSATNYDHAEHPNYYADVVYYIDDITVNYSSAVEDFDPPTISDVLLSHSGTDIGLEMKGQEISANKVNITAKAADSTLKTNYTGLNTSSLKMYVDGNLVEATCNTSGIITSGEIELANGMHTFRIEISDNRGNTTYVEKQIKIVASDNNKNTIELSPKDASLTNLLANSIYWMDLTATAIDKVERAELVIDLDNNSVWELDHMVLAAGFVASYTIDSETNDATITITRVDQVDSSDEAVLASLPIRVWTPHFKVENEDAMSYRLMAVEVKIEKGLLMELGGNQEYVGSETITTVTEFNGTRLNDGKMIGYHKHTTADVADLNATCTKPGYTGRTYCSVCESVVEWGTTVPATGHKIDKSVDGLHTCDDCGKVFYYVDGEAQTGWIEVTGDYYYFDANGEAVDGKATVDGHTYTFTNHILTDGAWEVIAEGHTVCWWAGKKLENTWVTIGGKTYYFITDVMCVGIQKFAYRDAAGNRDGYRYYVFDNNGVWLEDYVGFYSDGVNACWLENGVAVYEGLCQDADGNYYYMNSRYLAVKNCTYSIGASKTNGLLPAGKYEFGADGKMINPPVVDPEPSEPEASAPETTEPEATEPETTVPETTEPAVKNGLFKDSDGNVRYYENGVAVYKGLVQDAGGNYYYINSVKKAVKSCTYSIGASKANGLLPAGKYEFGADGKMINPPVEEDPSEPSVTEPETTVPPTTEAEPTTPPTSAPETKKGLVVDEDGEIRYYVDGVATYAGLVQDEEGNYYYINSSKKAVKSCTYGISVAKANGLLPAGKYEFGADGKMIIE